MSLKGQVAKGQRRVAPRPAPVENFWEWRVLDGSTIVAEGREDKRPDAVAATAVLDDSFLSPWQDI